MSRKPYVREISKTTWWQKNKLYQVYMSREVTCFFIFAYTLFLIYGIEQVMKGPEAYSAFLVCLTSPMSILFHFVILAVTVYHSVAWFSLLPKTMPILVGEEFLPGRVLLIAQYAVWALFSIIVILIAGV